MNNLGIQFNPIIDNYDREGLHNWHQSPPPIDLTKCLDHDFNMMPSKHQVNMRNNGDGTRRSLFKVGFEVEKNEIPTRYRRHYALYKGYERDASCGHEAVTNILPLVGQSSLRNKVFNMFYEAQRTIEDRWSPSNGSCGGHITLSVEGKSGGKVMKAIRPFSGIVYALFRGRLSKSYCRHNPLMLTSLDGYHTSNEKYSVCREFSERCEFRLPSRVKSVLDLVYRYELMYIILDFAINQPDASMAKFNRAIRPTLMAMYNQDAEKVRRIIDLSKHFTKMLRTGKMNAHVVGWLEGWNLDEYSRRMWVHRDHYARSYRPIGQGIESAIADFRRLNEGLLFS